MAASNLKPVSHVAPKVSAAVPAKLITGKSLKVSKQAISSLNTGVKIGGK